VAYVPDRFVIGRGGFWSGSIFINDCQEEQEAKMKKKMWKAIPILFTSTVLTSCATIMGNSANETLNVRSAPDQATVMILDESGTKIFEGKTPTSLPLRKRKVISAVKNTP